jgi:Domain of unknown function (DUF1772)
VTASATASARFVNPILLRLPADRRSKPAPTARAPSAGAAIAAAGLLAVSVVMSIALLVPINDRSATWTADRHPADWREQQRWDRLNGAR